MERWVPVFVIRGWKNVLFLLTEESLNDLMHVALSRVTVKNFNPEPVIEIWWNDSKNPGDYWVPMGQTKGLNRLRE